MALDTRSRRRHAANLSSSGRLCKAWYQATQAEEAEVVAVDQKANFLAEVVLIVRYSTLAVCLPGIHWSPSQTEGIEVRPLTRALRDCALW